MNSFFGMHISPDTLGGQTLPLFLAVVLGGLIGLERDLRGHPAGLRTHILVCVGATLITQASTHLSNYNGGHGDPGHVAAQIVSGIGFLGAGAIIREGATIRGLTTAASVWATAGIGIALGAMPSLGQLAVVATGIVLFTLWALSYLEDWLEVKTHKLCSLDVQVRATNRAAASLLARIAQHDVFVYSVQTEATPEPHARQMRMRVRLPNPFDRNAFLADLTDTDGVLAVRLE